MEKTATRGRVTYDCEYGHVCTCTKTTECDGHPSGPFDHAGETVYCDGTCSQAFVSYDETVRVDRAVEPTEGGSYWYVCSRCGAGAWSGC